MNPYQRVVYEVEFSYVLLADKIRERLATGWKCITIYHDGSYHIAWFEKETDRG